MAAGPPPDSFDLSPNASDAVVGLRLDKYLVLRAAKEDSPIAGMTRSRLQKLIDDGSVRVGGEPARASLKLTGAEDIRVVLPAPAPLDLVPEAIPLTILHEDADIVVIAKDAGMVVHPGAGQRSGTLVNALLAHCRDLSGIGGVTRPGIVHRLDRGTSGVLVIAKNDHAHESLAKQFARREVEKRYVAFVLGTPTPAYATIDTLYGRHPAKRRMFTTHVASGKRAVTTYTVQRAKAGLAQLDVLLGTGRTHQIRVHLSERNHPIVGDVLYNGRSFSRITDATLRSLCSGLTHQALHAASLRLVHPSTGETVRFEAPLPADLSAIASWLAYAAP